jgi:para-aminobenzoate synthetase component I
MSGALPSIALTVRDEGFTGIHAPDPRIALARELAPILARAPGTPVVVLLSGGDSPLARRSMVAEAPLAILHAAGGSTRLATASGTWTLDPDPFAALDALLAALPVESPPLLFGLLGYEAARRIERLPATTIDDVGFPDLFFLIPSLLHVHDRESAGGVRRHAFELDVDGERMLPMGAGEVAQVFGDTQPAARTDVIRGEAAFPATASSPAEAASAPHAVSSFTRAAYEDAVARTIDYIHAGDVYQVNLSQRFSFPFAAHPFERWLALFDRNAAPYYAYVDTGRQQVLSTSMERFLSVRGARVVTQPIKGTRARGATPDEDAARADELRTSAKDDAELSMIVDLMRNDLGHVCRPTSVAVRAHKLLDSWRNVHHLSSIVEGVLRDEVSIGEVLRATFPAGSITGCPKIRAMEIIDELEPVVRAAYTGSIGCLGPARDMELSVAIRTAIVHDGVCHVSVGGGIVRDSLPADEYAETLAKGSTLFDVLGGGTPGEASDA